MTERHVRTWRGVLVLLPCLWLAPALYANSAGLAQLAQQLDQASSGFAADLGSARGYASVRFAAERLGREAAELLDAIRRDRSRSYISAEFNDVGRHYRSLEQAWLRASAGRYDQAVTFHVNRISHLFSSLRSEFHYVQHGVSPYLLPPPPVHRPVLIRPDQPGQAHSQRRDRRDYGQIRARRVLEFDQRSSVLDRQRRQQLQQQEIERRLRRRHD